MRRQYMTIRGRSARPWFVAACVGAGSLASAGSAAAQPIDSTPPLPDVLLLLDSSGSMELMMDGCNTDTGLYPDGSGGGNCNGTIPCVGAACATKVTYCDGVTPRSPNRWAAQVAALTGSFLNSSNSGTAYSCLSMPRAPTSAFANEFSYQYSASGASVSPYDLNYYLNYHRPVENINATTACAYGFVQGSAGWNASDSSGTGTTHSENPASPAQPDFAAAAIQGYEYTISTMAPVSPLTACPGGFNQAEDGLINQELNSIRFGLMTIDSDTLPNSGVNVTSDNGNLTFTDVANGGLTNTLMTGMWSYYNGWENPGSGTPPPYTGSSVGRPAGCAETASSGQIFFEVGARNPAAPPWEGRLMRFPSASVASPAGNNTNIMQAIRVMRPYGANPIAGLMDDAKYYYWTDPQGPAGSGVDPQISCRPQYIILLSHAAPNLDLEPYCQGTSGGNAGICPYDYPENIAYGLARGTYSPSAGVVNAQSAGASGHVVKTFVVGFSLESSLGDAGEAASCSQILSGTAPNQTVNTAYCGTPGTNGADSGTPGNPIYASCCALARIAVNGGTSAPYFADNQTDLNAALSAIEAIIVNTMTTRATPVLLTQQASSSAGGGASPALFVSSFSPSSATSWSGNVQRERYTCPEPAANSGIAPYQSPSPSSGDDFQYNLNHAGAQTRNVIMVEPALNGSSRNASTMIRPWVQGTSAPTAYDGYSMYDGVEYGYSYTTASQTAATLNSAAFGATPIIGPGITPDALFPSGCSYTQPGMTLTTSDCELIALGWLLGMQNPPNHWNTTVAPYPNRYYTGSLTSGSPLGGVFHSTPVIATPPSALLRDDSYQSFSGYYTNSYATYTGQGAEPRHSVLYVATTDGLLHAFGVDYKANAAAGTSDPYTFIGDGHATEGGTAHGQNEMWSFVPPAVMPLLMNSVGGGSSILLDGAPVVKDTIFQRTSVGTGQDWHTTLVAGFGSAMGGYYALDVTDPSFANRGTTPNSFSPASHTTGNQSSPPTFTSGQGYMGPQNSSTGAGTPPGPGNVMPMGPHFLWQLMDSNLFASTGGTPAITTVSIYDPDTASHALTEVGVAILPGGASTPYNAACQRVACPTGLGSCAAGATKISDASPAGTSYQLGSYVRQWTTSGCPSTSLPTSGIPSNPARGRSLTVVRLDTGEVLRTFTVLTDIPSTFALYGSASGFSKQPEIVSGHPAASPAAKYFYQGRVTQADFDSPISGTPVPYPSDVGAIAQRVFVGDQDGTIWRLDVSNPNTNNWFVEPLFDAYNSTVETGTATATALDRAPVVLAPTVSIGRDSNVVLNFGTGDTNFIGTATNQNYLYSITELPNASAHRLLSSLNWYLPLAHPASGGTSGQSEMMTGPATVFDGGYYFATFRPASGGGSCTSGTAYIWGMDFTSPADASGNAQTGSSPTVNNGGVYKMTSSGSTVQNIASGSAIIPGVTITSTLACATTTSTTDPATGGPLLNMSGATPPYFQVSALQGKPGVAGGAAVSQVNIAVSVHSATLVDSWASIVE
jgi:type IV pilus assembly protein PilY1